jgi:formylmethanofuran--tetrahydromethanopterin N-formyltransferase
MQIQGVTIVDTFAEAFRVWAGRLVVTALDDYWLRTASQTVTGYGTSVIGCDAEAGVERYLSPDQTPDGRPGVELLFCSFKSQSLGKALLNRTGQCLMTCPTTAVYDGLPGAVTGEDSDRIDLGKKLRYFGDGNQKSKVIAGRRFWRVPVMDGEFTCEETCGTVKAIGGGNFLICGKDQPATLAAARRAVDAIAPLPGVITPFPGGVVRSGSKVGSRYKGMFASTNDAFCPTLRITVKKSELPPGASCVYEIVINGLTVQQISEATRQGILAACDGGTNAGVVAISAGNYGGKLGKFHFKLHQIMSPNASPSS